jgi:hypothetical protein
MVYKYYSDSYKTVTIILPLQAWHKVDVLEKDYIFLPHIQNKMGKYWI